MIHDYDSFLRYLYGLQENKIKPGLSRVTMACNNLGNPERGFKSIHIAGTNGKGSTAAFLESIIRKNGYAVGLMTSPHLVDVRERIQINRKCISKEDVVALGGEVFDKCKGSGLSYFEFLTMISFLYFSRQDIDVAILEVGLGGRWDATNVVKPILTLMTSISIDHTSFLGEDLVSIANEKCGIIKKGVPVLSARQPDHVEVLMADRCKEFNSSLLIVEKDKCLPKLELAGGHQIQNASLAVEAAKKLNSLGFNIENFKQPLVETDWPGRMQLVSNKIDMILDGAHNPDGCEHLVKYINEQYGKKDIVFVFGAMKDKKLDEMMNILDTVASAWIFFQLDGSRAVEVDCLKTIATSEHIKVAGKFDEVVDIASGFGFKNPLIVVCGSLYLVGKALLWHRQGKSYI